MEQLKHQKLFYNIVTSHIKAVNKYAEKLTKYYPYHDKEKLSVLFEDYSLIDKVNRTEEEEERLDNATLIHIKSNEHHPEYWSNDDLNGFKRSNPIPNGPIDVSLMTASAIEEMCCDWCAVADLKGNTPFEWFNLVNGKRWIFTKAQQELILRTLKILKNA